MEELLNKLIEKGWKPFGIVCTDFIKGTGLECIPSYCFNPHPHMCFPGGTRKYHRPSLRQIVSKESGLWQFVCENKMEKKMEKNHRGIWINSWAKSAYQSYPLYTMERYEYRIIESSLKDESELEEFLLSNIKINGTTK